MTCRPSPRWPHGLAALLLSVTSGAWAAPFTPSDDATVVQRLPYRVDAAERARRAALVNEPQQLDLAVAAARAAIERSRQHGDPRELGTAQALLAPWWERADAPPAVRLLRATVRQSQHQFDPALTELTALVDAPELTLAERAQALLDQASLLQLRGRLAAAESACQRLLAPKFQTLGAAVSRPAAACMAELRSLQGQADAAAQDLALIARADGRRPTGWLALMRAELAERRGDDQAAPGLYLQALAGSDDVYTRAAYADWLLARQRHREALALLERSADAEADALLLRRAIALKALGDPRAADVAGQVRERLASGERRGPGLHAREQARFALDVQGRAREALGFARANWAVQREPADAWLLQRAARAAGDTAPSRAALDELRQWQRSTGWQDARLDLS